MNLSLRLQGEINHPHFDGYAVCLKFVQNSPKMGSGGVLGASGGQETTREAPKTIFGAKMGGPGLQKGSKI